MTLSTAQRISCEVIDSRPGAGRIFNIQRYSLNDGRGIRTVVFFKGCPHLCPWCANPESISGAIETVRRQSKCLHCPSCLNDPDECPSGAMERIGRDVTVEGLTSELLKDDVFFRASGGGVTLSGGEVLMQAGFATALLTRLKQLGVPTAIETAGDAPASRFLPLARQCDEVLFDLKIMDAARAQQILRLNLPRVLDNLRLAVAEGVRVIPRLPLIPGYTLNEENLHRALEVLAPLQLKELHLLPFHPYGEPKYALLGKTWEMAGVQVPQAEDIAKLRTLAEQAGYRVVIGG